MSIDWNGLQVVLAIERSGTARAAGEQLKCSHSTVLRRLETFEQQLGAKLFDRTPEGFQLSAAGGRILGKAQQVEAEILELQRMISGTDLRLEGIIRLTIPPPIANHLILPKLADFKKEFPLVDIEIVATNEYSDLSRRDADIAIRFQEKPDEHLVGRRLPAFRDAIYATPAYIEEHFNNGKPVSAEWIAWSGLSGFRERTGSSPCKDCRIAWEFPLLSLQRKAAEIGLGVAFLPCMIGDPSPNLVRVPNSDVYDGRPAWLLTHADLRRMERVRIFSDYLYRHIQLNADLISGNRLLANERHHQWK